jgi:hypothetical protein
MNSVPLMVVAKNLLHHRCDTRRRAALCRNRHAEQDRANAGRQTQAHHEIGTSDSIAMSAFGVKRRDFIEVITDSRQGLPALINPAGMSKFEPCWCPNSAG